MITGQFENINVIRQQQHELRKLCLANRNVLDDVISRRDKGEVMDVVYFYFQSSLIKSSSRNSACKIKAHRNGGYITAWIENWFRWETVQKHFFNQVEDCKDWRITRTSAWTPAAHIIIWIKKPIFVSWLMTGNWWDCEDNAKAVQGNTDRPIE